MPRKFAALVGTGVAVVLVAGVLVALALGHQRHPRTTASSSPTPPLAAPPVSTEAPTPPGRSTTLGRPAGNPTAKLVAGNKKVIFLTFDDGPDPVWTPKILQVLDKYGAHATFFQLGRNVAEHPGLRERILAAGHTVGNHSVTHPQLTALPAGRRHHEIVDGPPSKCFRPPFGATDKDVRAEIRAAGMVQVLWTVDPRDWAKPGVPAIVHTVLGTATRASVILLHDGGGNRGQTVAALDKILRVLIQRGYSFPAMDC